MTAADIAELVGKAFLCWAGGFFAGFLYRKFIQLLELGQGG
jgi:hypothetical protein